ncbi:hypothetical protein [Xanthomonas fragariae]|uniref:hypothetical protein n=2 Tax=Xanthomonas fragariae TaxID=48664 RepID=UPI003530B8FA
MKLPFISNFHKQQPKPVAQGPSDTTVDAHRPSINRGPDPESPLARRPPNRKTSQKPSFKPEKFLLNSLCFNSVANPPRKISIKSDGRMSNKAIPNVGDGRSEQRNSDAGSASYRRAAAHSFYLASEMPAETPARLATRGQSSVSGAQVTRKRKTLEELFKETKEMHEADAPLAAFTDAIDKPASHVHMHVEDVGGSGTRSEIEELDETKENTIAPKRLATIEEESGKAEQGDIGKPGDELSIPWAHDANPKNLLWQNIDESHKRHIFNLFSEKNDLLGIGIFDKLTLMDGVENPDASNALSQGTENPSIATSSEKEKFLEKVKLMEHMEDHLLRKYQDNDIRRLRRPREMPESLVALVSRFREASKSAAPDSESSQGLPTSAPQVRDYFEDASRRASPNLEHFEFAQGPTPPTSDRFLENTRARYEEAVEVEVNNKRRLRQAKSLEKPAPKSFLKWLGSKIKSE